MTMHGLFPMLAYVLTTVLVAGLWQGALLVFLGAAFLRLMPRASATLRHRLLMGLFLLTVALPWVPFHHAAGVASSAHAVRLSIWTASAIAACWLLATLYRAVGLAIAWRHVRSVRRWRSGPAGGPSYAPRRMWILRWLSGSSGR
jgi:hypothetical protein